MTQKNLPLKSVVVFVCVCFLDFHATRTAVMQLFLLQTTRINVVPIVRTRSWQGYCKQLLSCVVVCIRYVAGWDRWLLLLVRAIFMGTTYAMYSTSVHCTFTCLIC